MRLRYAGIPKAIMMAKFPLLHHHTNRGAWHGMAKETRQREGGGGGIDTSVVDHYDAR